MKIFDNRAEAEVIGHVIILSITILGISMITLYGVPAIYSLQDIANVKNTEQAFTVLDSRASRASLGEALRQVTNVNLGGGSMSVVPNSSSEPSYILVELKNETSMIYSIPIPMGKIVYKLENREVAYEGGGVWSKYPSGSVMISPPEFHYNGITLTLPVVNISGNSSTGGKGTVSLNVEKKGDAKIIYPNAAYRNPIPENATYVNLTIKSRYYDAWESYFKSIPLTRVSSNAGEEKVTVTLETPPVVTNFTYGALASDEIELKNQAKVDSYNSSWGNYNANYIAGRTGNGSIRANNWIKLANPQVTVNGSALSGGNIEEKGTITKDAYANNCVPHNCGGVDVLGTTYPAVSRIALASTTSLVQDKINTFKNSNDNLDVSSGGCLWDTASGNKTLDDSKWSSNTCTISKGINGSYYLTKIELDTNNKNLIFDTNSGAINIVVDSDNIEIHNANITVNSEGINNPVKLYLSLSTGKEIEIKDTEINRYTNPNDTSSRFQVIVSGGEKIKFKNTKFCGFVYAPDAKIKVETTTEIFGALVGKKFEVEESQYIHFDEALQNLDAGLGSGTTIMYLHVTRNDIGVSIS
jgi:hypothetical protein